MSDTSNYFPHQEMSIFVHRFSSMENGIPKLSDSIENDQDYKLNNGNIKGLNLMDADAWTRDLGSTPTIRYCVSFFMPCLNPHGFNTTESQKYLCYFKEFQKIQKFNTRYGEKDSFVINGFPEFLFVNDHSDLHLKLWKKLPAQSRKDFNKKNTEFKAFKHDHPS